MTAAKHHYIKRTLSVAHEAIHQDKLLKGTKVTIVLAEPGAGKTELLNSLASSMGTERMRASLFRHKTKFKNTKTLIIDGLDEVAKIDPSAIDAIIIQAAELEPEKIIFASRSAQWEQARTKTIETAFGEPPRLAYLSELSEQEQRSLFLSYKPDKSFDHFKSSLDDLDIGGLLGNPQMLKIFADAYVRSNGKFSTKNQVFTDAIEQLATEKNDENLQGDAPPTSSIILQGDETFCKVLLSGSAGIAITEGASDHEFPYVRSILFNGKSEAISAPLTGLFKPSDLPDQHEPIHRIIAEYSAARYLVRRIQNSSDRLTLNRILSIIAPNNVPRSELRGVLAWMATQGEETIEAAIIELDPYAVISNGDPSLLSSKSKMHLLKALVDYAEIDPYFRGSEGWRTFSANGFFTSDIIEATKELLADNTINPNLRELILELLKDSTAASDIKEEILSLVLNQNCGEGLRVRALSTLKNMEDFDWEGTFDKLVAEHGKPSLKLAASIIEHYGVSNFNTAKVLAHINSLIELYYPHQPKSARHSDSAIGSKYFISRLVRSFNRATTIFLLDSLSKGLSCTCSPKKRYECYCRDGTSKMIGRLMDNLFNLKGDVPTPTQILTWTENLKFENFGGSSDSPSIDALQKNDDLRQAVQRLKFGDMTNPDQIFDAKVDLNMGCGHSGLSFRRGDFRAITDYAFETDNVVLWESFIEHHRLYEKKNFPNPYRAHMRKQAYEKTEFGKAWAKQNRAYKKRFKGNRFNNSYVVKKHRKRRAAIKSDNQKHFDENIEQISQGRDFWWLRVFANGYLSKDDKYFPEMVDPDLPTNALIASFGFIAPNLPKLTDISTSAGTYYSVNIAHAACLAHFRKFGHLDGIRKDILLVVKTKSMNGNTDDRDAFNTEINRHILRDDKELEEFIRTLVEPQLENPERQFTNAGWLSYQEEFHPLRQTLAIEWLERFPNMNLQATDTLFEIAATHCDRSGLEAVIDHQIKHLGDRPSDTDAAVEFDRRRDYWQLRKFLFFNECDAATISWLKENKERILEIQAVSGRIHSPDDTDWKKLDTQKIEIVLDTFIDKWPKVSLPSHWGTGDPPEQTAYRFISELFWQIDKGDAENALSSIDRFLSDERFSDFTNALKTKRVDVLKALALRNFSPPTPETLVNMLDNQEIASVEDMRALLLEFLEEIQSWISGAETNPETYFYNKQTSGEHERVDENTATKVIVDRLQLKSQALGLSVTIEHHLHDDKRSDFTLRANIEGTEYLLVTEVKGQWHKELYTAAATQLSERYMGHPNAADQGVYIAIWFGAEYSVAGVRTHEVTSASELKLKIEANMPDDLKTKIDVFVLDVSH